MKSNCIRTPAVLGLESERSNFCLRGEELVFLFGPADQATILKGLSILKVKFLGINFTICICWASKKDLTFFSS